jgi:hypothetical protein
MNSSGANPSRLVPPGSCNQNANPPVIADDMPDNMISTAKSILGNEIWSEIPDQNRSSPKRRFMPVERNSAQLCFFRRLTFSAELSLRDFFRLTFSASTGIFLLRPET